MTLKSDGIAYAPRGMSRTEAARYIGVSPVKFDQLVADRRMPKAKHIDGRVVWDRYELDAYFSELQTEKSTLQGMIEKRRVEDLKAKHNRG